MVRREQFINKIRELGYKFKLQRKRVYIWRRVGGTHFIPVPKADLLEDPYVTSALKQAGLTDEQIKVFIASTKS